MLSASSYDAVWGGGNSSSRLSCETVFLLVRVVYIYWLVHWVFFLVLSSHTPLLGCFSAAGIFPSLSNEKGELSARAFGVLLCHWCDAPS